MVKKKYTRDEVLKNTMEYFHGDELSANVWINKYCLKDAFGNFFELSPNDMHKRIAGEINRIEKNYKNPMSEYEVFDLIKDFKYIIPQGGSMSGIGNVKQVVSLSNCFVIGNKGESDSYGGVMRIDEEQVQLMKRRGGVGHDLSHIRPKGTPVKNSALTSTGVVPFMERYSNSTREVGQDGRRGALMLSMDIHHPNAEDFMNAKLEEGKVTGANISLRVSDEFMAAATSDGEFTQQYPIGVKHPHITQKTKAKPLLDKLVYNAWKSAEPGILFWDTIIKESVADCYADDGYKTVSTNPCGEITLSPYDSCRLLVQNLYSYVVNPFTEEVYFDFLLFRNHVRKAQRIMDDILDLEIEKIDQILLKIESDPESDSIKSVERGLWEKIKESAINGRRTGLGITGEGDMIAAMGLTYGTKEATVFATKVHEVLAVEAYKASSILAKERGSFPVWDREKEKGNPFLERLTKADPEMGGYLDSGRRNIALLTISPSGTVSLMTQTTSGIESAFLIAYKRNRKVNPNDKDVKVAFVDQNGDSWESYSVLHHHFKTWAVVKGYNLEDIKNYTQEELDALVKISPYYKATANDVDWLEKVRMQGSIQKWIDHSISVTVNLPKETTKEIVGDVYTEAWKSGCKGITVYRDGSRTGVLVSNTEKVNELIKERNAPKRPKNLKADVLTFQNHGEKWIGFIGLFNDKPYEMFTGLLESFPIPKYVEQGIIRKNKVDDKSSYDFIYVDKDGYEQTMRGLSRAFNKEYWNYGKLISGVMRHGMPILSLINVVSSLDLPDLVVSWKAGVIRMFKKYIIDNEVSADQKCPECGNKLTFTDGCLSCIDTKEKEGCGWSKCG